MAQNPKRWEVGELYAQLAKQSMPVQSSEGTPSSQVPDKVFEIDFSRKFEFIVCAIKDKDSHRLIGAATFRQSSGWEIDEVEVVDKSPRMLAPFATLNPFFSIRIEDINEPFFKEEILDVWVATRNLVKRGLIRSVAEEREHRAKAEDATFGKGEE